MKNQILIALVVLLLALRSAAGADEQSSLYNGNEWSLDLFGSGSIERQTVNYLSGAKVRYEVGLGEGGGLNYFFSRHLGIGAEARSGNARHRLVDDTSLNLIARLPLGDSGLAPYGFVGAGRQFGPARFWHGQLGAGLEWRFNARTSLFFDGRYVIGDGGRNYGLGRGGVRFTF